MNEIPEFFQQLNGAAYVIGVAHEGQHDLFAAASVMLASRRPLLLAVSIDRRHASYPLMRAGRVFSVSVVRRLGQDAADRLGARLGRKLQGPDGLAWHFGRGGAPIPDDGVLASFECEMNAMMSAGDHQIMLGAVLDSNLMDARKGQSPYRFADRRRNSGHPAPGIGAR